MGVLVGDFVIVGECDGLNVGLKDGMNDGLNVGINDGLKDGLSVGINDGLSVGIIMSIYSALNECGVNKKSLTWISRVRITSGETLSQRFIVIQYKITISVKSTFKSASRRSQLCERHSRIC